MSFVSDIFRPIPNQLKPCLLISPSIPGRLTLILFSEPAFIYYHIIINQVVINLLYRKNYVYLAAVYLVAIDIHSPPSDPSSWSETTEINSWYEAHYCMCTSSVYTSYRRNKATRIGVGRCVSISPCKYTTFQSISVGFTQRRVELVVGYAGWGVCLCKFHSLLTLHVCIELHCAK